MQMVKKIFIVLFVVWFAFLVLMPKKELYFKLEEALVSQGIKINERDIDEGLFTLTLHESDIYAKGIKLASAEEVTFFTLLFYTKVDMKNIQLDASLQNMLPTQIEQASLTHGIWNPANISVQASGAFAHTEGNIALTQRTIHLDFNETQGLEMLEDQLKQDEKGWYYETSF